VVHLSYTAREGGGRLKAAAEADIDKKLNQILTLIATDPALGLVRAFSLRREFPDVFHKLLVSPLASPPAPLTTMTIVPEHFPYVIRQRQMKMRTPTTAPVSVRIVPKVGKLVPSGAAVSVFSDASQAPMTDVELVPGFAPQDLFLKQSATPLVLDDVEDVVVIVNYTVDKPKA